LLDQDDVFEKAFNLFSLLRDLQQDYLSRIKQPVPFLSKEIWKRHLDDGEILLKFVRPDIDAGLYVELAGEICALIARNKPEKKEEAERVAGYFRREAARLSEDLLQKEKNISCLTAEFNQVSEQEFAKFVVQQALRPFLQSFVSQLPSNVGDLRWQRDYCPVCGEKANLSYLRREDGKRVLICPLCGKEWLYRYLICTWCGNNDNKSIKYFETREVPGYEVYVCEQCGGYLKTFNEKKKDSHEDWMLEDVKTIPLDLLACREGYGDFSEKMIK